VVSVAEAVVEGAPEVIVVGLELVVGVAVVLRVVVLLVVGRVLVDVEVGGTYVGEALAPPWPRLFLILSNCEYG
jgi:hypothetical protein